MTGKLNNKGKTSSFIFLTRNFPPLRGGMERLNFHLVDELQKENEVFLVGPQGADAFCADPTHVKTSPPLPVWRFLMVSFLQTLYLCLAQRPQLIIAGSGIAALPAVLAGRLIGIPVLTYLHGLDIIVQNVFYQSIFMPMIRRSQGWLVNSRNTRQLAINAGIPAGKIEILNPGTDLPDLSTIDGGSFRDHIGVVGRPILLSVGRQTRRKGLLEFVEHALLPITLRQPDVLLLVIGSDPIHSVSGPSGVIGNSLQIRIAELGLEGNVLFLGEVDDQLLGKAYLSSQLHVFPGLDLPGDVEGFGMVAIEAAAHGLPTIAFAVGGVPDSVDPGVSGWLIEPGNYSVMADTILRHLNNPSESTITASSCRKFAEQFAWPLLGGKLNAYCRHFLDGKT